MFRYGLKGSSNSGKDGYDCAIVPGGTVYTYYGAGTKRVSNGLRDEYCGGENQGQTSICCKIFRVLSFHIN